MLFYAIVYASKYMDSSFIFYLYVIPTILIVIIFCTQNTNQDSHGKCCSNWSNLLWIQPRWFSLQLNCLDMTGVRSAQINPGRQATEEPQEIHETHKLSFQSVIKGPQDFWKCTSYMGLTSTRQVEIKYQEKSGETIVASSQAYGHPRIRKIQVNFYPQSINYDWSDLNDRMATYYI